MGLFALIQSLTAHLNFNGVQSKATDVPQRAAVSQCSRGSVERTKPVEHRPLTILFL